MQLRASHGRFRVLAVGDPRQCASVAAGPVIELLRQALGVEAIPEIHSTVRQREQLERETTGLFREGRAAEALARKRADGTAQLVPGGPEAVAEALADLWWERHVLHAGDPRYSLSVSAPTNVDALMVAGAIREPASGGRPTLRTGLGDTSDRQCWARVRAPAGGGRPGPAIRAHGRTQRQWPDPRDRGQRQRADRRGGRPEGAAPARHRWPVRLGGLGDASEA